MNYEVEQKFAVDDLAVVERRLSECSPLAAGEVAQVDTYFNHPARDFAQTDEALRIRRVGNCNYVTYKGPKLDSATKSRREIELPLGDGDSVASELAEMLTLLGFRPSAQVRKRRRAFSIIWEGREVEIALDEVDSLGTFVELETSADQGDLDAARSCIASLARSFGLSQSERRSYLELLLEKR